MSDCKVILGALEYARDTLVEYWFANTHEEKRAQAEMRNILDRYLLWAHDHVEMATQVLQSCAPCHLITDSHSFNLGHLAVAVLQ